MSIPKWVCEKLAEVDPNARIGFDGKYYSLIKLYRSRDLEKKFIAEPDYWNGRGPIYNIKGGTSPVWDLTERTQCEVTTMNPVTVVSGACIDMLKSWIQDVRDVQRDELLKNAKEYEEVLQNNAEQMTDYAQWHHRHAYKIGEVTGNPITANKFHDKEKVARIHGDAEPTPNRYMAELKNLEYAWRSQGWIPKEERDRSN